MSVSMEAIEERAKRESSLLRHYAVAAEAQSVQPMGQPINISTNRGFNTRIGGKQAPPSVEVVGAGREGRVPRRASVSRLGVPALGRVELLPFCDEP